MVWSKCYMDKQARNRGRGPRGNGWGKKDLLKEIASGPNGTSNEGGSCQQTLGTLWPSSPSSKDHCAVGFSTSIWEAEWASSS